MRDAEISTHKGVVSRIVEKELQSARAAITRLGNGICNEVYLVNTGRLEAVVRMNKQPRYVLGSHNHIPIFRALGIRVPEILAEDYTKSEFPFAYHVLSKIEGRDIQDVIANLTGDELLPIAREVANIFKSLSGIPNNGKFGVVWGDDLDLVDSWSAEVSRVTEVVFRWGESSGVLNDRLKYILGWINDTYRGYFDDVRPVTYFGDLAGKNVMIDDGRFSGLVDLDALAQGDPLEAVGRIKASWYGTRHGSIYSEALIEELELDNEHKKIVTMYALLNRSFWTLENGVQFNANTSREVNREREMADKSAVEGLLAELQSQLASVTVPADTSGEPAAEAVQPEMEAVSRSASTAARQLTLETVSTSEVPTSAFETGNVTEHPALLVREQPASRAVVRRSAVERPVLEASALSKTYADDGVRFDAVKNVDLKIMRGDCLAIVGKSGSGKSTLMHLLACLDQPSQGYVYVEGDDTTTMSETEKNILRNEKFGFVFQHFFLNGRDTVFENVVLPLRIRGVSDYELLTEANAAIESVGLADKKNKCAKDLSGGEKQRVCIARALIGKPQVIFADEPTGNLDSTTGAAVERLLFDMNLDKGITLVIVTHDPDLAKRCGRLVEMKDGRIIAQRQKRVASAL